MSISTMLQVAALTDSGGSTVCIGMYIVGFFHLESSYTVCHLHMLPL